MKLQMGHATSFRLWRESGMTGCSQIAQFFISFFFFSFLSRKFFLAFPFFFSFFCVSSHRRNQPWGGRGEGSIRDATKRTMKQIVIHDHVEMQWADQFPPVCFSSPQSAFPAIALLPPPPSQSHQIPPSI